MSIKRKHFKIHPWSLPALSWLFCSFIFIFYNVIFGCLVLFHLIFEIFFFSGKLVLYLLFNDFIIWQCLSVMSKTWACFGWGFNFLSCLSGLLMTRPRGWPHFHNYSPMCVYYFHSARLHWHYIFFPKLVPFIHLYFACSTPMKSFYYLLVFCSAWNSFCL